LKIASRSYVDEVESCSSNLSIMVVNFYTVC
jgi:hypothetical protein